MRRRVAREQQQREANGARREIDERARCGHPTGIAAAIEVHRREDERFATCEDAGAPVTHCLVENVRQDVGDDGNGDDRRHIQ